VVGEWEMSRGKAGSGSSFHLLGPKSILLRTYSPASPKSKSLNISNNSNILDSCCCYTFDPYLKINLGANLFQMSTEEAHEFCSDFRRIPEYFVTLFFLKNCFFYHEFVRVMVAICNAKFRKSLGKLLKNKKNIYSYLN